MVRMMGCCELGFKEWVWLFGVLNPLLFPLGHQGGGIWHPPASPFASTPLYSLSERGRELWRGRDRVCLRGLRLVGCADETTSNYRQGFRR